MALTDMIRVAPPGLVSGMLFFTVVLGGSSYIVLAKLNGVAAIYVTLVPVAVMVSYALLLGFARLFRLRDDQSGDNLYYMGFLFTLTSLAVSLHQFTGEGSSEHIVQNFGVAIASTIAGIALRIFFNQMRRDPVEVEHVARLELAEAARKVRRELDSTVLEFSYFRRATQQSIAEAAEEMNSLLTDAKTRFVGQLDDFATTSSKPIEEASKRSGQTIDDLNSRIVRSLDDAAKKVVHEAGQLSASTSRIVAAIDGLVKRLSSLQTPDQVIEIKLSPMIQGLTRAVNTFAKNAEGQATAVNRNLKQTQMLGEQLTQVLAQMRALEAARDAAPPSTMTVASSNLQTAQALLPLSPPPNG